MTKEIKQIRRQVLEELEKMLPKKKLHLYKSCDSVVSEKCENYAKGFNDAVQSAINKLKQ